MNQSQAGSPLLTSHVYCIVCDRAKCPVRYRVADQPRPISGVEMRAQIRILLHTLTRLHTNRHSLTHLCICLHTLAHSYSHIVLYIQYMSSTYNAVQLRVESKNSVCNFVHAFIEEWGGADAETCS